MPTNIDSNETEWRRIRGAQRTYPASRSTYYNWIVNRQVRSKRINGARYIDMESLRRLFESAPEKPPAAVRREMTKRAFASADKRAANGNGGEG
jgi:hypothetical protein